MEPTTEKSSKKPAQKNLKQKRAAKQTKKSGK